MTLRLLILTSFAFLLLTILGCGYAKHIDPPVYTYNTETLTVQSAILHAADVGGYVTLPVANTHSMEPVLWGGDRLVYLQTPLTEVPLGSIILYRPVWNPALLVCHRIVARDGSGLLVEGDNVDAEHPENHWRVTQANYVGAVVSVYRVKP